MSKPYWHCDDCSGNFDHGEKCDCCKYEKENDPGQKCDCCKYEKENDPGPVLEEKK